MGDNKEREITPLLFLEAVYLNPDLPLATRLRAAIEAAPYKHPKQSVTAIAHFNGQTFAEALDRCIERSRNPPMLNSPKTIEHEELVSASELKKPFPSYRRF